VREHGEKPQLKGKARLEQLKKKKNAQDQMSANKEADMANSSLLRWTLLASAGFALSACAVGPNYKRPAAPMQASYREAEGWTPATPLDHIDRGAWWSAFNDPVLDQMERQVPLSNLNIAEAEAAYRQAKAVVVEDRAALLPAVSASLTSSTNGWGSAAAMAAGGGRYKASVNADWAFDVFGKLRRQLEAGKASAQSSAAALANARLAAQSALAIDYFTLRGLDAQADLLKAEVANLQRALDVAQNQYKAGVAARADVIAAETQLDSAKASLLDLGVHVGLDLLLLRW
jgi:outer membrane protein TolC